MANNHLNRLLRLARRTGDRLIVTDENGGEPIVILPIDEYEALIEGVLGPDFGSDGGEGEEFDPLPVKNSRKESKTSKDAESGLFETGEPEEELESIEIPVVEEIEVVVDHPTADEVFMAPVVPERGIEEASDEADIDERAIEELWRKVEPHGNQQKVPEMPQKGPQNPSTGEERFYLENID